jgi:hypothetical protein
MSSTQESDGNFQSWFGSSRWKTALYVGLPLLGVGVMGVLLWRRHSAEEAAPEPQGEDEDITTDPPQELVCRHFYLLISKNLD